MQGMLNSSFLQGISSLTPLPCDIEYFPISTHEANFNESDIDADIAFHTIFLGFLALYWYMISLLDLATS
jgi:hypothetical protein